MNVFTGFYCIIIATLYVGNCAKQWFLAHHSPTVDSKVLACDLFRPNGNGRTVFEP